MMIRHFACAFVLLCYVGISQASDLKLSLDQCLTEPAQITDIEFIAPHYAIMTNQLGDVYWFRGCNRPAQKIGHVDVAMNDWRLGLYSIAVPHDFFWSHNIYLYYAADVEGELKTRLSRFNIDLFGDKGLTDEVVLIEIDQPYTSSNGGALKFGPDGLLYLGVGDGGSNGDPDNNAQNVETILGSILRIKPDPDIEKGYTIPEGNLQDFIPGALPEIFAYGVRNPWKFTFAFDGSLILGDVGEDTIEEVDIITKEMIGNQEINLGWPIKEGSTCYNGNKECSSEGLIDPVYQYEHGNHGNSITGGETYVLGDKEYYVFADFMTGMIGVLDLADPSTPVLLDESFTGNWVTFGRTPLGRVYISDYDGNLYRVILQQ
jgi:glucose/arabinose dehydrogenase